MRKGFTLAEVLGVVAVLSLIMILIIPPIANQIIKSKQDVSDATLKLIYNATELYIDKNQNDYPIYDGNIYCISLQKLVDNNDLKAPIKDIKNGKDIDLNQVVKITIINPANIDYELVKKENCDESYNRPVANADKSGASIPELSDGMIPIKWDGNKWVKADKNNPDNAYKWYDYNSKEWANAVLVNSSVRSSYTNADPGIEILEADVLAYLVWIPRYKYKLFNVSSTAISPQEIEIRFEDRYSIKSTGSSNGEWLTHPAFTFGTTEINGIWVGKFETTGNVTTPTIKPGMTALRNQNLKTHFTNAQKLNNTTTYGLTSKYDAHLMKNMEWGAVAYLSHSKYGKNSEISINNSANYYTGGGASTAYVTNINQSTTGNVYGIYDMSGGSYEYLMGGMYSDTNKTKLIVSSSGFTEAELTLSNGLFIGSKYVDMYDYGTSSSDYSRRKLGDATGETRGWYSDSANFLSTYPWFARGGIYSDGNVAGAFYFGNTSGSSGAYYGFRIVVSVIP